MQLYPLLKTKLYIPPARPELVSRPRLIERLEAGLRPQAHPHLRPGRLWQDDADQRMGASLGRDRCRLLLSPGSRSTRATTT